jgi:hypothetical protein
VSHLRGLPEQMLGTALDNSARMRGCSVCSPPKQQAALNWPQHFGGALGPALLQRQTVSHPIATHRMRTLGTCRLLGQSEHVEIDPRRTFQLFSRDPPRYTLAGCDLTPNDIDVTAQIIDLVREG